MNQDISVIGLGKLGAPMAAVFAEAGNNVIGVDLNECLVEAFNAKKMPWVEKNLNETLARVGGRASATTDYNQAINSSSVTFIIVPTPSGDDGQFSNNYLLEALSFIGKALQQKNTYHLVVITSTVMPGSTDDILQKKLEETSGRTIGDNLGICYSPEFIALGSVIRDLKNPDLLLIGESDKTAGQLLANIYRDTCENSPAFFHTNFVNAELAKIAINGFVTAKISYINMLSELCDQLPGADIDAISQALGTDSRIGRKYLKGGAAFGGPCFPRDNAALNAFATSKGVSAHLANATQSVNETQINRLIAALELNGSIEGPIGIMGLAYKPDTLITDESAGKKLAAKLAMRGSKIHYHDPAGQGNAPKNWEYHSDLESILDAIEALVITTPWPEFAALPSMLSHSHANLKIIVDPWRLFAAEDLPSEISYVALGRPANQIQPA